MAKYVVHRVKKLGDLPTPETIECGNIGNHVHFAHNWDRVTCKRCLKFKEHK